MRPAPCSQNQKQARGLQNTGPHPALWFFKVGTRSVLDSNTWTTSTHYTLLPLLLHKSWWQSEHMIMSMMCLRLLSQHCCWWSHSKLRWFVQQMSLTINFFPIKSGMVKWLNLGAERVSVLLIQPLIFLISFSLSLPLQVCPMGSEQAPYTAIFDSHTPVVILQTHSVFAGFADV